MQNEKQQINPHLDEDVGRDRARENRQATRTRSEWAGLARCDKRAAAGAGAGAGRGGGRRPAGGRGKGRKDHHRSSEPRRSPRRGGGVGWPIADCTGRPRPVAGRGIITRGEMYTVRRTCSGAAVQVFPTEPAPLTY